MVSKKLKRGTKPKYGADFRAKVCFEVMEGKMTVYEAKQLYGLKSASNIYRWLEAFKQMPAGVILQAMSADKPTAAGEGQQPTALEQKNRELEAALELAKLKNIALEMMIDIAESELQIDIRKKPGTKQRS